VLLAAAVWLRQLLNDLRAEIGEPLIEHYNVLRATRQVREDLGVSAALSFEGGEYMDQNSQMRPMIRFSDDVFFPVVGAVGGKVPLDEKVLRKRRTVVGESRFRGKDRDPALGARVAQGTSSGRACQPAADQQEINLRYLLGAHRACFRSI
jgi:hypothetical protein